MSDDDGIVVGMPGKSVGHYLDAYETMRRQELVWGVVREPPAPRSGHQRVLTSLTVLLDRHVRPRKLGAVCVAPVDVVLDEPRALVVQPDLIFISAARAGIIRDRVWGAPDLVVEVLSCGTARHDRTTRLGWYQRYGIRECWLVDPVELSVEVIRLRPRSMRRRVYDTGAAVRSGVLRTLRLRVSDVFRD